MDPQTVRIIDCSRNAYSAILVDSLWILKLSVPLSHPSSVRITKELFRLDAVADGLRAHLMAAHVIEPLPAGAAEAAPTSALH